MSRSTIRPRRETSGKSRPRKWTLRALTTVVLTAGSVATLAGPAQAYDATLCEQVLGPGNTVDVDQVRIDTSQVDFGDLPHTGAGGGAPRGDAVVCWARDPRIVAVVGRGFYDSPVPGDAEVEFEADLGSDREFHLEASPGAVVSSQMRWLKTDGSEVAYVRIKLKICISYQAGTCGVGYQTIHLSIYQRGD